MVNQLPSFLDLVIIIIIYLWLENLITNKKASDNKNIPGSHIQSVNKDGGKIRKNIPAD